MSDASPVLYLVHNLLTPEECDRLVALAVDRRFLMVGMFAAVLYFLAVILVANEVGLSVAPETALGNAFRDEAGLLNQRMAACADRVDFIAAGLPLRLKG